MAGSSYYPSPLSLMKGGGDQYWGYPGETCPELFSKEEGGINNCKGPIVVEWPPQQATGPGPDLLAQIPASPAPQTIKVVAVPEGYKCPNPRMTPDPRMGTDKALHRRAHTHSGNQGELRIRMPPAPTEPPIRGPPCRQWTQCVESSLVNDQVRRPLARMSYKRPVPPLYLSAGKYGQLKSLAEGGEKEKEAREAWCRERECQRLESRRRQGEWNYTVETLLQRKRQEEKSKEEGETQEFRKLMEEVKLEKKAQSEAQMTRAKRQLLYRKGLIKDLHSAMAYSKMMQEIQQIQKKSDRHKEEEGIPMTLQKCHRKMTYQNETRADHAQDHKEKKEGKKVNPKICEALKSVRQRGAQHKAEIDKEMELMKKEIAENLPEFPEAYKKYMAVPKCDDNQERQKKQARACELYASIGDKLSADAYIEHHELEIDRQADEFTEYKRQVDAIRKSKEQKLIKDKVDYNIRKSEAAAKVLVQMQQAQKKKREDQYGTLRLKWESDLKAKAEGRKKRYEAKMDKIMKDFEHRKLEERERLCKFDNAREWARTQLLCEKDIDKECDIKNDKRKKAEELALYNKNAAIHKHCELQSKKVMDHLWATKMKEEYIQEMKEMKDYAKECIDDWRAKGRSTVPMEHAMKKWDFDGGMRPELFRHGDGAMDQKVLGMVKDKNWKGVNGCGDYQSTSKRLGFASGGT